MPSSSTGGLLISIFLILYLFGSYWWLKKLYFNSLMVDLTHSTALNRALPASMVGLGRFLIDNLELFMFAIVAVFCGDVDLGLMGLYHSELVLYCLSIPLGFLALRKPEIRGARFYLYVLGWTFMAGIFILLAWTDNGFCIFGICGFMLITWALENYWGNFGKWCKRLLELEDSDENEDREAIPYSFNDPHIQRFFMEREILHYSMTKSDIMPSRMMPYMPLVFYPQYQDQTMTGMPFYSSPTAHPINFGRPQRTETDSKLQFPIPIPVKTETIEQRPSAFIDPTNNTNLHQQQKTPMSSERTPHSLKGVVKFQLDTPRHKRLRSPPQRPRPLQSENEGLPPVKSVSTLSCLLPKATANSTTKRFQKLVKKAIGLYKVDKVFRKVHRNRTVEEAIEIVFGYKSSLGPNTHLNDSINPLAMPSEGPPASEHKTPILRRNQTEELNLQHEDAFVEEPEEHSVRIDYSGQETFGAMTIKKSISDTPSSEENTTQYNLMKLTDYNPLKVPEGVWRKIRWVCLLPTKILFFCLFPNMMDPPTDEKIGTVVFTYLLCTIAVIVPLTVLQAALVQSHNIKPHLISIFNGLVFSLK